VNRLLLGHLADASVPLVGAPVVEETAKALALVVVALAWRELLADVPAAVLAGAAVGVGFALTENVDYLELAAVQGGPGGLVRALYLRGLLGGLVHAVFTASAAAGLAARPGRRAAAATLGLLAAVVQHVVWNGVASGRITALLCNPARAGGPCRDAPDAVDLLVSVPLVVAAALGPGVAALVLLVRHALTAPSRPPGDAAAPGSSRSRSRG